MFKKAIFCSATLSAASGLISLCAQSDFVIDSVTYTTVGEYAAGGANVVDVSATDDGGINEISLETFQARLAEAFAAGNGGVIDFEAPREIGSDLRAIDKRLVNSQIRQSVVDGTEKNAARRALFDSLLVEPSSDPYPALLGHLSALDGQDEAFRFDISQDFDGEIVEFDAAAFLDPVETLILGRSVAGYIRIDRSAGEFVVIEEVGEVDGDDTSRQIIERDGLEVKVTLVNQAPQPHILDISDDLRLVDQNRVITVEDRRDREFFGELEFALRSQQSEAVLIYSELRATYGLNNENAISIRRGPNNFAEADLATPEQPGPREITNSDGESAALGKARYGPINDEFYFITEVIDDRRTPVSGSRGLHGGSSGAATAKELLFDPRDNIIAFGFTLLSFNNFQFWQGLGSQPDNADNIRVRATFIDTETGEETETEYFGTTQQSNARDDTFFGIEAPNGAVLTRVQVRVVGRNSRTFTNLDDLAFITRGTAPFISSGASHTLRVPYAAVERPYFRQLEFQRNPTSIIFGSELATGFDLAAIGLEFDEATGLISGTPPASILEGEEERTVTLPVTMANEFGERVEEVTFIFRNPQPDSDVPMVATSGRQVGTLGRDFAFTPNVTLVGVDEGNLDFIVLVERLSDDSEPIATSLDNLGLSLSNGQIIGVPEGNGNVGDYDVAMVAVTPEGSTLFDFILTIVPPTAEPNFDAAIGNTQTDVVLHDAESGTISISLLTRDGQNLIISEPVQIVSDLPTDATLHLGDFNADSNTDILAYSRSTGDFMLYAISGTDVRSRLLNAAGSNSPFEIIGIGDLNRDGASDVVTRNTITNEILSMIVQPIFDEPAPITSYSLITPFVFQSLPSDPVVNYELLSIADFDGDSGSDLIWRNPEDGSFVITPFNQSQFTGSLNPYSSIRRTGRTTFVIDDGYEFLETGDFNGDGLDDIFWINRAEGLITVWEMSSSSPPEALYSEASSENGNSTGIAIPGNQTIRIAEDFDSISTITDFNGDNRADLLFTNDASESTIALLNGNEFFETQFDYMQDRNTALGIEGTPRPEVERNASTGRFMLGDRDVIVQQRFLNEGETGFLNDGEALDDSEGSLPLGAYQIFEQATDDEGLPLWEYDDFHALPVADTSRPLEGDDVFLDGYFGIGEALIDYQIYVRRDLIDSDLEGFDEEGRPLAAYPGGRFNLPTTDEITEESFVALDGSQDLAWTPMELALDREAFVDGVDGIANYDGRGNRGFLQKIDLSGNPIFDVSGEPVYELWRSPDGAARTVLEQSILDLVSGSIRQTIGGEDGSGLWLTPDVFNVNYADTPSGGQSGAEFNQINRETVTNGILDAVNSLNPSSGLPLMYEPSSDVIGFDLVQSANEDRYQEGIQSSILAARDEVVLSIADELNDELFETSATVEEQISAVEKAIIDALQVTSLSASAASVDDFELFTDDQLEQATERAIAESISLAVAESPLFSLMLKDSFQFVTGDATVAFFGNGDTDFAVAIEYGIIDALNIAIEKLQGAAIRFAIRDAVNATVELPNEIFESDIPLELVSLGGNPFTRLSESDKEEAISNAIVLGVNTGTGDATINVSDFSFTYSESDDTAARELAIREAILEAVSAAQGTISLNQVVLDLPEDANLKVEDLSVGFTATNSLEQNASAINQALADAVSLEFETSIPENDLQFTFYTASEFETLLLNALTDIVDQVGGDTEKISTNIEIVEGNGFERSIRSSIEGALVGTGLGDDYEPGAFLNTNLVRTSNDSDFFTPLSGLSLPPNATDLELSEVLEDYLVFKVFRRVFSDFDLSIDDISISFDESTSLAARESMVESAIQSSLRQFIPLGSFATADGLIDVELLDDDGYLALPVEVRDEIFWESLQESIQLIASFGFGFGDLDEIISFDDLIQKVVDANTDADPSNDLESIIDEVSSTNIVRYIRESINEALFGELDDDDRVVVELSEQLFELNEDSSEDWLRTIGLIERSILDAFPVSELMINANDGFTGNDYAAQGDAVLGVVAESLSQVTGTVILPEDLGNHAFPADVVLYALDYDRNVEDTIGNIVIPQGFEIVASGDYDNDGGTQQDLLVFNSVTDEYRILFMDGVRIKTELPVDFSSGLPVIQDLSEPSLFVLWLRSNFGDETLSFADADADPDGDRSTNLLEYASGVELVADASPAAPTIEFDQSLELLLEFNVRDNDPGVSFRIMSSSDLLNWNAHEFEVVDTASINESTRRYRVRIDPPSIENSFFKVDYTLDSDNP